MSALPGWQIARLDELCDINPPKPKLRNIDDATEVMFVPMAAVDDIAGKVVSPEHSTVGAVGRKSYRSFTSGDVLFAKITPCMENGKAAVVPTIPTDLGFGSTEFHVLRPKPSTDPRLIWHLVRQKSFRDEAAKHFTGTVGQLRVPADFVKSFEARVPIDKATQSQLATLLDAATARALSAGSHLSNARRVVGRFRQAVLAAACSGRLTADWRKAQLDVDNDGDLPAGWRIVELQELAADGAPIRYGIVKPGPEVAGGVPYVRQQDVIGGTVLVDQLAHTSAEIAERYRRSALREGDVLLGIIRNLRVAMVPPGLDGANITQGMVRIRPRPGVEGGYLKLYLESPAAQRWMHDQYVGLAMPRINVQDARVIPVPLPPEVEQAEIVERATEILSLAYEVATRVERAAAVIDCTAEAVLAKAFRGELVGELITSRL